MDEVQKYFYAHYDELMPMICQGYDDFLDIAARAIPIEARSIAEFGIGTGNFSKRVQARIPGIEVHGIDKNPTTLEIAARKLNNFHPYHRDFFDGEFPSADYFISSLAMHHLPVSTRRDQLLSLASGSRMFINFDFALFSGRTFDETVRSSLEYCRRSFSPEEVKVIECEMRANDNYMSLREQIDLFESAGFNFRLHGSKDPFVVYSVSKAA